MGDGSALLAANVSFVLVTENLADLSTRIIRSPQTVEIEGSAAGRAERLAYLQALRSAEWFIRTQLLAERLAQLTSGLTRSASPDRILGGRDQEPAGCGRCAERRRPSSSRVLRPAGVRRESTFALDMVAGHEGVKERLRRAARAIVAGRLRGVPMGYLIAGPVGSAKTFLVTCFTGEIGFPCVKFLNFRSQWQGVTEGNLEKILKVLHAMSPVGVIIDEADAFLGDRNQEGDSGTSNRVFASLASFMGNTEYRGKIVWFLIPPGRICRPSTEATGRAEAPGAILPGAARVRAVPDHVRKRAQDLGAVRWWTLGTLGRRHRGDLARAAVISDAGAAGAARSAEVQRG
jgi:hypothetical protein